MRHRLHFALVMCLLITTLVTAQSVPNIVKFSGVAKEASGHVAGMMFTVYKDQKGGSILWQEMQNVTVDADGHYTALLGSASSAGLGANVFADGQARWIGVKVEGHAEHERMLLAAVPYSMKAQDASTLNGMTADELVAQSLHAFRQQNLGPRNSSTVMAPTADIAAPVLQPSLIAAALINTTATTFTDTNTNQVVQVTQNGTGAALRANTASTTNNAIYGINTSTTGSVRGVYGESNSTATSSAGVFGTSKALTGLTYGVLGTTSSASGTALNGTATSTTGTAIGLRGQSNASAGTGVEAAEASTTGFTTGVNAFVNSASGVAGVFDNRAGGQILSLDNNGNEKLAVDGNGNTVAAGSLSVSGATFVVDGTGNLTAGTVPQARVTGLAASLTTATSNANTYTDGQISTEVTNRNSAIGVETTNRTNADSALSTSISNETTARTNADALKANLAGGNTFTTGKQTLAAPAAGFASLNLPGSATAPTSPAVGDLWLGTGNIHPNFVDNTSTTQSVAFLADVTAAGTSANSYTDSQISTEQTARTNGDSATLTSAESYTDSSVSAEASARSSADSSEASARSAADSSEASTRAANDTANLATAESYTDSGLALKANLAGGNTFTGTNNFAGVSATGAVDFSGATSTKAFRSVSTLPDPNSPTCTIGEIVFAQDTLLVSVCKDVSGTRSWVLVNTATSNTGVLAGNGAGGVTQITGSLNQVLQWNGSNWVAATVAGTGTVTSVGLSAPAEFSVSGTPVTSVGTLALAWAIAPTSSTTANAIVERDASGNFSGNVITSTVANGTAPLVVTSSTAVANLTASSHPVIYNATGTKQTSQKMVVGTLTMATTGNPRVGSATFTGNAVFTSAPICTVNDRTAAQALFVTTTSSTVTATSGGNVASGDSVAYICVGN